MRAFEETTHREQPILRAVSDEVERRMSAEGDLIMWASQPVNAEPSLWKENPQRFVNTEYRRNARESVHIERESAVLTRPLAAVIGSGPRWIPEDEKALLFRQSPQIRNSEKGS